MAAGPVLVLHPDPAVREFLAEALLDAGYRPVAAAGVAAALAAAAQVPALVLAGTVPDGTFGRAFARAYARRPGPRAPVVLLTTDPEPAAVTAEEGVAGALPEPFDLDDLLAVVRRLAGPPAAPPP